MIRAGAGIFYSFQMQTSNLSPAKKVPFSGSIQTANNAQDWASALPISAGFPASRPNLFPVTGTAWVYYPGDFKTTSNLQWNFNVQREVGANNVLTVAYVGAKGTHVFVTENINQAIPGSGTVVSRRPYPNLGDGTAVSGRGITPRTTPCRRRSSGAFLRASRFLPRGRGRTASIIPAVPGRRRFRTPTTWL